MSFLDNIKREFVAGHGVSPASDPTAFAEGMDSILQIMLKHLDETPDIQRGLAGSIIRGPSERKSVDMFSDLLSDIEPLKFNFTVDTTPYTLESYKVCYIYRP